MPVEDIVLYLGQSYVPPSDARPEPPAAGGWWFSFARDDPRAFLESLPANLDEYSMLLVAVLKPDGRDIGFADGLISEGMVGPQEVVRRWRRLSTPPPERLRGARRQVVDFARRMWERRAREEDQQA